MQMKELAEMLEEELAEAFEVKNQKSLHRYVVLLTSGYVEQESHQRQFAEVTGSIKEMLTSMKEGFRRMDDHFGSMQKQMDTRFAASQKQMDERFNALQKQMDERFSAQELRFEDVNKRFDDVNRHFDDVNSRFDDMNKRFDDMNKRFDSQHRLISLGFAAIALIITAFNLTLILT